MKIWKDIKGYEGLYQISNCGKIKSLKRWRATGSNGYWTKEKILSRKANPSQYITTGLSKNGVRRPFRIHRLVAEAFIPNPEGKPQVNHIDGDKHNNNVNNLEWVTPRENSLHAVKLNPDMIKGMIKYNQHIKPKDIFQYTLQEEFIRAYPNAKEASKLTGVCQRNILQVASKDEFSPGRTRKQAGGYIWRFKEDVSTDEAKSAV